MRVMLLCVLAGVGVVSTGCSSLIKGMVNTQPRVTLEDEAYADPATIVKGEPVVYEPVARGAAMDADLLRHAPMIVQGTLASGPKRPAYEPEADRIGTPRLDAAGNTVHIDTLAPAVFARVEHPMYNGVPTKALVYVFWYPQRPVGSIETGTIDGGILRITLDHTGTPAVFEYSQPCGCFHGVFVSSDLEARARSAFPELAPHRLYAVEPELEGEDWVVRDLVDVKEGGRLVLYMSAGKHFCEAMRYADDASVTAQGEAAPYDLQDYASLDALAREGGGTGSMFNDAGLVLGGRRWKEELAMGDLDHPGWPRRLDVMKIHWDAETWSDPNLIDRHLRIPGAAHDELAGRSMMQPRLPLVADLIEEGHQLVLFTNRYCEGCQVAKALIRESSDIRSAMDGWEYEVVDTATPEGAARAAAHHVTVVPVLIGMTDGREIFRTEDLDGEAAVIDAIGTHAAAH